METLVYIALGILTLSLFGALFLAPTCSLGYRPLLSGYAIVIYTMILYNAMSASLPIFFNDMISFLYPSYSGPERFFVTLCVCWFALLLFVGFYHFFSRRRPMRMDTRFVSLPANAIFPAPAYLCIIAGLLFKVLYIMRSGGLHVVLVSRSESVARNLGLVEHSDSLANNLGFLSMTADAAACWLLLEALRTRKQVCLHAILTVAVLAFTYLITPKREFLIMPIFAIMVGISVYIRPLRLVQAPLFLFGALSFSLATLAGRIFLPAYLAGINVFKYVSWDVIRTFGIRLISADTAFFDATAVAIYGRHDIISKFGSWASTFYRPNFEPFLYIIPRLAWPTKPEHFVDMATGIRAMQNGVSLDRTIGGTGIGLVGTSWMYGELIGLVVGMALLGWAASFVDRFLPKMHAASGGRIMVFAVSLTLLFHFYRQGTVGWTFLAFVQTMAIFWLTTLWLTAVANKFAFLRATVANPSQEGAL